MVEGAGHQLFLDNPVARPKIPRRQVSDGSAAEAAFNAACYRATHLQISVSTSRNSRTSIGGTQEGEAAVVPGLTQVSRPAVSQQGLTPVPGLTR